MEINIRDKDKIVEIWLTKDEKNNAALRDNLRSVYGEYKNKKYTVAVFESGARNVFEAAEGLVVHNFKVH